MKITCAVCSLPRFSDSLATHDLKKNLNFPQSNCFSSANAFVEIFFRWRRLKIYFSSHESNKIRKSLILKWIQRTSLFYTDWNFEKTVKRMSIALSSLDNTKSITNGWTFEKPLIITWAVVFFENFCPCNESNNFQLKCDFIKHFILWNDFLLTK